MIRCRNEARASEGWSQCVVLSGMLACLWVCSSACLAQVALASTDDNPCTSKWTGPDRNNEFDCDEWQGWLIAKATPIVIPFAISSLFAFPGCCVLLLGRYCCQCFGSSKMRPGHCCCGGSELDHLPEPERMIMYSKCSILTTKFMTLLLALLGLVIVILCFVGGTKVGGTASDAVESVTEGIDFFLDIVNQTLDGIKDPNDGSYPDGFHMSDYDEVFDHLRDINGQVRDEVGNYDGYIQSYTIIPAYIAVFPALLMSVPLLLAIFNVRTCAPLGVICCSFGVQFIFMVIATIFAIILVPINLVCGELDDQLDGSPGIFQWYVVPTCDTRAPFRTFTTASTK
jgi:hypothetical protein